MHWLKKIFWDFSIRRGMTKVFFGEDIFECIFFVEKFFLSKFHSSVFLEIRSLTSMDK